MRVALLGCGRAKLGHPAPASELYTSALFRLSLQYARQTCDAVYVLSVLHGLVHPNAVLAPYDWTLSGLDAEQQRAWAWRVAEQLAMAVPADATLVLLAGRTYDGFRIRVSNPIEEPLRGMGIGRRLAWLKANTVEQRRAA